MPMHDSPVENALKALSLAGPEDEGGDTDCPTGHFALIFVTPASVMTDMNIVREQDRDAYEKLAETPEELLGNWIIQTDSLGFLHSYKYPISSIASAVFQRMVGEYASWLADQSDV